MSAYEGKTVAELRELAASREIAGRSEMNQEELVRALTDQDQNDPEQMRQGQISAVVQQAEAQQSQIDALASRVTQLELRATGQVPNDPIPQRR